VRELNQNATRLSIEWARIEPSEGEFDSRQIRHYRDVLGELREQGITPMVTLHHFTNPQWFARKGGWTARGSARAFMPTCIVSSMSSETWSPSVHHQRARHLRRERLDHRRVPAAVTVTCPANSW